MLRLSKGSFGGVLHQSSFYDRREIFAAFFLCPDGKICGFLWYNNGDVKNKEPDLV